MIKYNNSNINDWDYGSDNIVKVYRNNAVCYYKITSSGGTSGQTPCFAVVEDISQYSDTEFEDVFNKADEKWYKLNNLNQYEEYGVYGSGRTITYYEGKLTIDSETSSRLPSGYTEVEYIERDSTHNGYVGLGEYFQENTKIEIDFQMTQAKGNAIIGDYGSNDNDDWRVFLNYDVQVNNWLVYDFLTSRYYNNTGNWSKRFHIEIGNYYIKDVDSGSYLVNRTKKTGFTRPNQMYLFHMEGTQNTNNIDYGHIYSLKIWQNDTLVKDFVPCYRNNDNTVGLYDIVGNEFHGSITSTLVAGSATYTTYEYQYSGSSWNNVGEVSGGTEYPIYYDEKADPPNNLTFSSMTEAEEYECPWVGMQATIDGDNYVFSGDSQSGYEWVYNPSRLPAGYTEVEYVQNTGSSTVNIGIQLMKNTGDSFSVVYENEMTWTSGGENLQTFLTCTKETSPYPGWYERFDNNGNHVLAGNMMNFTTGRTNVSGSVYHVTVSCTQVSSKNHDYPLNLFSSLDSTKSPWRFCNGKLYNMQVTYNNTLVRDLVPCYRKNDNVAGLYDLVNNVFYTSESGYDALVAGNPV